jgi:hypothetical protein
MQRHAVNADRSRHTPINQPGIGQWQTTLDRFVWVLRRAGIPSAHIIRQITRSVRKYRRMRRESLPSAHELAYPRVVAHWQDDNRFLDGKGRPRSLPYDGPGSSFRELVQAALPEANPVDVLAALKRYRLVSRDGDGPIRLLRNAFVPRGPRLGYMLYIILTSLQGLAETCYENIRDAPRARIPLLQRYAYTEHFDARYLRQYDRFLRKTGRAFLRLHQDWLRRHERAEPPRSQKPTKAHSSRPTCLRVGVGLYGMAGF